MAIETVRWTDGLLEPMRQVTDPRADEVIAAVVEDGDSSSVNKLFTSLVQNDGPVSTEMPPVVRDYFRDTEGLPEWSNEALVRAGEEVFGEFGPQIVMALFCASLPECYAAAKGAHVLGMTARMQKQPFRRIIETGQFLIDVMAPGGLSADGRGLRAAQKVRLMHAAVRHMCRSDPEWNHDWGEPINQEDLVGTLMTFSTVALDAVARLGMEIEPKREEAYFHAWKNVGYVLGVRSELLPSDVADGRALMGAIRHRQDAASLVGQELTAALVKLMSTVVPGIVFDPVPAHLIRFLVGNHIADLLSVPSSGSLEQGMFKVAAMVDHVLAASLTRDADLDRVVATFNQKLLEGMIWVARDGTKAQFQIPVSLADRWRLSGT